MRCDRRIVTGLCAGILGLLPAMTAAAPPDVILCNAKVVTVSTDFAIAEAVAWQGDRIVAVGSTDELRSLAGPQTEVIDLNGKTVLPGLIDSHVHPTGAAVYEFDHEIPPMESIADVLDYVRARAAVLPPGEWIVLNQVFITRLADQRFPNRYELDAAAPLHPVLFRTGPDAALNSLALELNGIDKNFEVPPGKTGKIERDPETGEPTGILRSSGQFAQARSTGRSPGAEERRERLRQLLADYNSVGITSISDRGGSDSSLALFEQLHERGELTCRLFVYYGLNYGAPLPDIEKQIEKVIQLPRHQYNPHIWVRGIKIFLDGGMLTGSAYMQQPWGKSSIYGISDPDYRGIRNVDPEKLYEISKRVLVNNLQMTAHAVGDGAVQTLVDTYALIDADDFPVRDKRPCVTHCNFMTQDAIETMARLGIVADLQPAWLWLDGRTLLTHFGEERLQWFQPYHTLFEKQVIVGGGSDHMQKIGSLRSVNPYNPFLGMWIALSRLPRGAEQPLHPNQRITREQVIRLYTINNAWITFEEKEKGSLEPGKLADLIVLDTDLLTCPEEDIRDIQVEQTFVGGRRVYQRQK